MIHNSTISVRLPPEQEAIRQKCFHPSGSFIEFRKEEIEQSIPSRFEKIARKYPDRIAVKTESHVLTYAELNATANRVARAASTFYLSGFEESLILVADGMGELDSTTVAVGSKKDIKVVKRIRTLHSFGILYGVFTLYLGIWYQLWGIQK